MLELSTGLKTTVTFLCLKGAKYVSGNTGMILWHNWILFTIQLLSTNTPSVSTDLHPGYFARRFNFIIGVPIQSRNEDTKTQQQL